MKTFLTALCIQRVSNKQPISLEEAKVTDHVGVLELLEHLDVVELDVEVLVDALEDAADLDVVLELDRDLVVNERLKEAGWGRVSRCICDYGEVVW